jgi:tRNA-dihydrouridine synthase B
MTSIQTMLQNKLIAAPLAGISCAPFRVLPFLLKASYARPDYSCTEMLSAKHIASGAQQNPRFIKKDPREGPLCVQIAAETEKEARIAAEFAITAIGADILDLNCGCPKPKIRKKGLGSKLLEDSKTIAKIIKAMQIDSTPVTAKIRIDSRYDNYNTDVAKAIEDAGAAALTVHGRHWTEDYCVPINYTQIADIKSSISIPVIANGDIYDAASAKKMFIATNCDALMIGRAAIGRPWVFAEIAAKLTDTEFEKPSAIEIRSLLLLHVHGLANLIGEVAATLQARRFCKHYFPEEHEFINATKQVSSIEDIEHCLDKFISS